MIYRLGELFCGPGGIAWGATNADIGDPDFGIIHQWANDYDASTCDTYRHNICPGAPQTVYQEDKDRQHQEKHESEKDRKGKRKGQSKILCKNPFLQDH